MTDINKVSAKVTPIKKSMKFQEEEIVDTIDIDDNRFEEYEVIFNGRRIQLLYDEKSGDIVIDDKLYPTNIFEEEEGIYHASVAGNHKYKIEFHDGQFYLEGRLIEFNFSPATPKLERKRIVKGGDTLIHAPLPGNVIDISVTEGETVEIGQKLLTLEAMKMQNDILCEGNGSVTKIFVNKGETVTSNQKLILISSDTKE